MTKEMKQRHPNLLLLIVSALGAVDASIFALSLPSIVQHFGLASQTTQWTVSYFLLGNVFGQLSYGPLANRFGRKTVLCIGLSIAISSCCFCLLAGNIQNYPLFAFARFLMAMGSGAGLHIAFTIIGDLYSGSLAIKIFSFAMLTSGIIRSTVSFIGGLITKYVAWWGCLYFLIIFETIILAVLSLYLRETVKRTSRRPWQYKEIVQQFQQEWQNTPLLLCAIITGCGASIVYLFASAAPFIGINLIGLQPDQYGAWTFIPSIGLIIGSLFTARFCNRISTRELLSLGSKILIVAALLSLAAFYFGYLSPWALFFPMLCLNTGIAVVCSTTAAIALAQAKDKAIGSSVLHFINLGICFLFVFLNGILSIKNPFALPLSFLFLVFLIFFLMRKLERSLEREPIPKQLE